MDKVEKAIKEFLDNHLVLLGNNIADILNELKIDKEKAKHFLDRLQLGNHKLREIVYGKLKNGKDGKIQR